MTFSKFKAEPDFQLRFRGWLRLLILKIVDDEAKKGCSTSPYEIIDKIGAFTRQKWKPSPGSVYPILKNLIEDDLIEKDQECDRYRITEKGKRDLQALLFVKLMIITMSVKILFSGYSINDQFLDDFLLNSPFILSDIKEGELDILMKEQLLAVNKQIELLSTVKELFEKKLQEINLEKT